MNNNTAESGGTVSLGGIVNFFCACFSNQTVIFVGNIIAKSLMSRFTFLHKHAII